jgi:hypothetical protein
MPDGYANPDSVGGYQSEAEKTEKRTRQRGEIGFCYVDLSDAIAVARALLDLGGIPCERDQLGSKMGHSLSGAFVNKTSAAKQFGLVELTQGKFKLTPLGHAILDDGRSTAAKAEAFLHVALHRRIYEAFRNTQLPPSPTGLEQAIAEFGVPEKQKGKARRAFENSAQQAGFFAHGKDRLVAPVIASAWDTSGMEKIGKEPPSDSIPPKKHDDDRTSLPTPADHPFIKGLLLSLPSELRSNWTAEDRVKWLRTAADAFDLMFKGGSPITITFSPAND